MLSICSRCRLRLASRAPSGHWLAVRGYANSVNDILNPPDRDELTRAIHPDSGSRNHAAGSSVSKRTERPGYYKRRLPTRNPFGPQKIFSNDGAVHISFGPRNDPKLPEHSDGHSTSFAPAHPSMPGLDPYLAAGQYRLSWKHVLEHLRPDVGKWSHSQLRGMRDLTRAFKRAWWLAILDPSKGVPDIPTLSEMFLDTQKQLSGSPALNSILAVHGLHMVSLSVQYNPAKDWKLLESPVHRALIQQLTDFWVTWSKASRNRSSDEYETNYNLLPKDVSLKDGRKYRKDAQDTGSYLTAINPHFAAASAATSANLPVVDFVLCLTVTLRKAAKHNLLASERAIMAPFLDDMEAVLHSSSLDGYKQQLTASLKQVGMKQSTIDAICWALKFRKPEAADSSPPPLAEWATRITTSLARYRERSNLDLVEQSWNRVKARLESLSVEEKAEPESNRIYDEFLLTFRALRRADHALEVWNHMITNGYTPTVRTWNVMLKGCHIGKEVDAMEQIWQRMLEAGVRPNAHSWGIRIHGLFQFRKISQGYRALAEMSDAAARWRPSHASEEPPPKPNTVTLNSALSGLARHGPEPVKNVLAWANGLNIKPDIVTYNILINLAVHSGAKEDARQLMQRMSEEGIAPDSATFTILLHSMFEDGFLMDLAPAEQEERAMAFIRSLEADGLSLDVRGYALLIDRLLKECENERATRAVLAHMIARGIEPTAHMYTILMTHYFDREPPDVAAVEALWEGIRARKNYVVDVIFHDRMLEGFARADKVTKMKYFLQRMAQEGKRPGWVALLEVLRCLRRMGDAQGARQLIEDVERAEGNVKAGVRGRKGYDEFWGLASEVLATGK